MNRREPRRFKDLRGSVNSFLNSFLDLGVLGSFGAGRYK